MKHLKSIQKKSHQWVDKVNQFINTIEKGYVTYDYEKVFPCLYTKDHGWPEPIVSEANPVFKTKEEIIDILGYMALECWGWNNWKDHKVRENLETETIDVIVPGVGMPGDSAITIYYDEEYDCYTWEDGYYWSDRCDKNLCDENGNDLKEQYDTYMAKVYDEVRQSQRANHSL